MLGLVFIYFIGRYYYQLAEKFNRNKWGYGVLGVATYYGGTFVAGAIAGILDYFLDWMWIDTMDERILGLAFLPFGIAATYFLYQILKKNWMANEASDKSLDDILNSDL